MRIAEDTGRTSPCVLDLVSTLGYANISATELSNYINAVSAKKEKTRAPFTFPRPEPASFPTSD
jgi:hypothetical protein